MMYFGDQSGEVKLPLEERHRDHLFMTAVKTHSDSVLVLIPRRKFFKDPCLRTLTDNNTIIWINGIR